MLQSPSRWTPQFLQKFVSTSRAPALQLFGSTPGPFIRVGAPSLGGGSVTRKQSLPVKVVTVAGESISRLDLELESFETYAFRDGSENDDWCLEKTPFICHGHVLNETSPFLRCRGPTETDLTGFRIQAVEFIKTDLSIRDAKWRLGQLFPIVWGLQSLNSRQDTSNRKQTWKIIAYIKTPRAQITPQSRAVCSQKHNKALTAQEGLSVYTLHCRQRGLCRKQQCIIRFFGGLLVQYLGTLAGRRYMHDWAIHKAKSTHVFQLIVCLNLSMRH